MRENLAKLELFDEKKRAKGMWVDISLDDVGFIKDYLIGLLRE